MDFNIFCSRIGLTECAKTLLSEMRMEEEEYEGLKRLFWENQELFFEAILKKEGFRQWFLYLYCHFACDAYEEYRKRRIGDAIYFDTFSDIAIWCESCRRIYREEGIMEYDWLWRHVKLDLFRIGRLQYERARAGEALAAGGIAVLKGQDILNVHIPAGQPLEDKACTASLRAAGSFFPKELLLVCHSWLLYPGLRDILKENSNILRFQSRFQLLATDFAAREAEERIFLDLQENPENYPQNSSLMKNAREYLMSGKRLGSGLGIMRFPD